MEYKFIKNLVSIGMPVFNDKEFLEKSIISILNQTYQNFELIISDDGSTDGSEELCKNFVAKDSRITYIRQASNLGISKNMEFLLDKAKGEFFMWAGDDDLYENIFIESALQKLFDKPDIIVAFPGYAIISENDNILMKSRHFNFSSSSPFWRLFKLTYYWDDGFGYGLFRTEQIKHIKFPIWKGKNRICAYGNIFPTLYFYLSKGNYASSSDKILFLKRKKTPKKINHSRPYDHSYLRGMFFEWIRYLNLFTETLKSINSASNSGLLLSILISPFLVIRIFFKCISVSFWNTKWLIQGRKKFFTL